MCRYVYISADIQCSSVAAHNLSWQTTCSFLCALHCTVALCGVDASVVCAMGDVKSLLHISDWYKSVVYRKVSISTNAMLKVKTTTLWKHQGAVWSCLANLAVRCEQCPCSGGGHGVTHHNLSHAQVTLLYKAISTYHTEADIASGRFWWERATNSIPYVDCHYEWWSWD